MTTEQKLRSSTKEIRERGLLITLAGTACDVMQQMARLVARKECCWGIATKCTEILDNIEAGLLAKDASIGDMWQWAEVKAEIKISERDDDGYEEHYAQVSYNGEVIYADLI